jgi:hypothetical protein
VNEGKTRPTGQDVGGNQRPCDGTSTGGVSDEREK